MKCRKQEGMTLVEVVISIMVLSIAMTIVYTGFVSASRLWLDAKQYDKLVQEQKQCILDKNGTRSSIDITFTQDHREVNITGDVYEVKDMHRKDDGTCEVLSASEQKGVQPFVKYFSR